MNILQSAHGYGFAIATGLDIATMGCSSGANDWQHPRELEIIRVTRAAKVWNIRQRCIRANDGVLWNDHGDVLRRVIRRGEAIPTKIGLADVLLTWKWVYDKRADKDDSDQDATDVFNETASRIETLWDRVANDLTAQSDKCIDLLAEHLLVDIPVTKRTRT